MSPGATAEADGKINFSFCLENIRVDENIAWITLGLVKLKFVDS